MIRFIDISNQITEETPEFSFFDTVTEKFLEFNGKQTFEDAVDFILSFQGENIDRFLNLIPKEFYNE